MEDGEIRTSHCCCYHAAQGGWRFGVAGEAQRGGGFSPHESVITRRAVAALAWGPGRIARPWASILSVIQIVTFLGFLDYLATDLS